MKSSKRRFFGFSRNNDNNTTLPQSSKKVEVREAGMEGPLLKQIEKMDLRAQMERFYTTYSKYIVVKYDSFAIQHYSRGIVDILDITTRTNHEFVGTNVFKFIGQHTSALPREFKSKVQQALKNGLSISASINLFTIRSLSRREDDKFFTHWTPLKDENSHVRYAVMTLSSTLYE